MTTVHRFILAVVLVAIGVLVGQFHNVDATAANVSQVIQTLLVAVALLFALYQVQEVARARSSEGMKWASDYLRAVKLRDARRLVYGNKGSDFSKLPKDVQDQVMEVAISFDLVGSFVFRGYLDAEAVYDSYGDMARRCWKILRPFIVEKRVSRGEAMNSSKPHYLRYFQLLAENSEAYLEQHYPDYAPVDYKSSKSSSSEDAS